MAIPRNLSDFAPKLTSGGGFGSGSAATPTALGTVYGKQSTSGASPFLTAFGYNSAPSATGTYNSAFGQLSLFSLTSGSSNTAVGEESLYTVSTGNDNVAVGVSALYTATGSNNTTVGTGSMFNTTTGDSNTAVGHYALRANTSGAGNVALGRDALLANTTASHNVAVGYLSLDANTTGFQNTCVGWKAGTDITTGQRTVCVGDESGLGLTTGQLGVYVGGAATPSGATVNYEMVIGAGTGKGSSTGYIIPAGGGANVYQGNNSSTWSTTSDRRLKKNIVDNNSGLEKLTQIQIRNFEYRLPNEVTELPQDQAIDKAGVQLGVIAQELQAVLPDCIKTESTGVMSVNSDNLTWYMINAIKELKAELDAYKASHP